LSATGSGVTAVGASTADVLSVSGSDLVADDPNADRIVFWDDSESKLRYLEAGSGLSISGTTMTASGGVSAVDATTADVFSVSGSNLVADDPNADRIVYWNNTSNRLAYGTPSDVGAAASAHTHAAADVTSGTFDNARINFAAPSAIGSTTPNTGAFSSLSASSSVNASNIWGAGSSNGGVAIRTSSTSNNFVECIGSAVFVWSGGNIITAFNRAGAKGIATTSDGNFAWGPSSTAASSGDANSTKLFADDFNIIAQRNGTNSQEMRCYGTHTSSTNFQRMTIRSVKQTLSALSGASATTTGTFIPGGAVVVGVTTRVATALTGAAGYQVGDGTDADRWGDITGTAIGTTSDNANWTAGTIECFTAGGEITLTAKTSNFTAGAIEICVFYLAGQAD
jgi:hypothetical protein